MKWLMQIFWMLFGHYAKLQMLTHAKRRGALVYLRVVQGSRRALLALFLLVLLLQLMMLSFVGALVTGMLLIDMDFETKIQILFGVFATLFVVPFGLLLFMFSDRVWFKASGAQGLVDNLGKDQP